MFDESSGLSREKWRRHGRLFHVVRPFGTHAHIHIVQRHLATQLDASILSSIESNRHRHVGRDNVLDKTRLKSISMSRSNHHHLLDCCCQPITGRPMKVETPSLIETARPLLSWIKKNLSSSPSLVPFFLLLRSSRLWSIASTD